MRWSKKCIVINSWFNAGFTPLCCHGLNFKVLINHQTTSCGRRKRYVPELCDYMHEEFDMTIQHCFSHLYSIEFNLSLRSAKDMKNKITLMLTSQRRLFFLYIWWAAKEPFLYVPCYMFFFRTLTIHKHNFISISLW